MDINEELLKLQQEKEYIFQQFKEISRENELLKEKLYYNPQTGLPNHFLFRNKISQHIKEANISFCLFFIQLDDHFHNMKHSLQQPEIEWIIYQISRRLTTVLPKPGEIFQTKPDEFACLLLFKPSKKELLQIYSKFNESVSQPISVFQKKISINCYIGCAYYPLHAKTTWDLLSRVDVALRICKKDKKRFCLYRKSMAEEVQKKRQLFEELKRAICQNNMQDSKNKEFVLHYQPVYKLEKEDGKIMAHIEGAEVLIRWQHPQLGIVPPLHFIPVAEENGLILPLGTWILYEVFRQLHAWQANKLKSLSLAVNISARQFEQPDFVNQLARMLKTFNIESSRIKIEITESMIMQEPEVAIEKMQALKKMGVEILVDDFGTGYSSLSYLQQFPIDTLKIDKSFISNLEDYPQNQGIARAIIQMAKTLKLNTLAEGVENLAQLERLYCEGCTLIQGFFFSKPLPLEQFIKQFQENSVYEISFKTKNEKTGNIPA